MLRCACLTFNLDLCRAKNIPWSMAIEVLMAVAAIGLGQSRDSPGIITPCIYGSADGLLLVQKSFYIGSIDEVQSSFHIVTVLAKLSVTAGQCNIVSLL